MKGRFGTQPNVTRICPQYGRFRDRCTTPATRPGTLVHAGCLTSFKCKSACLIVSRPGRPSFLPTLGTRLPNATLYCRPIDSEVEMMEQELPTSEPGFRAARSADPRDAQEGTTAKSGLTKVRRSADWRSNLLEECLGSRTRENNGV
jgi:hypothetical protein